MSLVRRLLSHASWLGPAQPLARQLAAQGQRQTPAGRLHAPSYALLRTWASLGRG
jgi:hypothetical protein